MSASLSNSQSIGMNDCDLLVGLLPCDEEFACVHVKKRSRDAADRVEQERGHIGLGACVAHRSVVVATASEISLADQCDRGRSTVVNDALPSWNGASSDMA